ncbi:MAG: anthranilate phosphoribosyltransferase [Bryobacteraceae bacterium]
MALLDYLHRIVAGERLSIEEARAAMDSVLSGDATSAQIAGMMVALRMRGETAAEVAGFAQSMRAHADVVDAGIPGLLDTCGTGGDGLATFNISTVTAFVVAACGVPVAKHGNRSMSSHCGSADLLEALGVNVGVGPDVMARAIRECGIGFLYAPALHPAMKFAGPVRKELRLRTVFNLLGPLANPANAAFQLIGAPSVEAAELMANALATIGIERAFVVHGDGLDEVTLTGETVAFEVTDRVERHTFKPADFGLPPCTINDLRAPTKEDNVRIAGEILAGNPGPPRNIVLANAAIALRVAGRVLQLSDGVALAAHALNDGTARQRLDRLASLTNARRDAL